MNVLMLCLLLPLLGTSLGSCCVFFLGKELKRPVERGLIGFAAGVMVAASVWSLLIPAIEMSEHLNSFAFLPGFIGMWVGALFLLALDKLIPHLHLQSDTPEGPKTNLGRLAMLILAVTLHNIPEGIAVGAILVGALEGGNSPISDSVAISLALGIAIQNFPEGAVISMPLKASGKTKLKAFTAGVLSGIVEPIATLLTVLFSSLIVPILPYFLSFAAGAMIFVVVEELIPEMSEGEHSNIGVIAFTFGFTLMMALDVAFG